jgi:methionine-rich copper-binding protein CopC
LSSEIGARGWRAALAAALLAAFAGAALGHAFLDHAAPRVGSSVREPPQEVKLWFTQELEPAFSTVRVFDQDGKQVDRNDKRVDPADRTVMIVSLSALQPGRYRVVWRALSVDTHVTEGDFTFELKP